MEFIDINNDQKKISISPQSNDQLNITLLREFERTLQARFPEWSVIVIPNVQMLPVIYFDIGESDLSDSAAQKLDDAIWALRRWNVRDVMVMGYASTLGGRQSSTNRTLAYNRAKTVADVLEGAAINTELRSEFGRFDQTLDERNNGINSLHKVEIRLNSQ